MKYLSLFSGIGGFELGINKAYEQTFLNRARRSGKKYWKPECVGYSEIDKYAIQIYNNHFNHHNYGDIKKINAKKLPDFDLLVGGFPCQSFSIAGKRGGFNDTRGTLFFEICRIIKQKQPRFILLENVKGLLSHDKGRTFGTMLKSLDGLGYDLQWQVLNSKNFGVPQNRERVLIVGHIRKQSRPEIFPIQRSDESCQTESSSNTIDVNYSKGIDNHGQRTHIGTLRTFKDGQGFREVKSGLAPTIQCRAREDGSGQPVILIPEATKIGFAQATIGDSINLSVLGSKTRRGRVGNKIAQTLDTGMQQYTLSSDMMIRRLTPVECERLQGFPDNWTEGISDTQRYKCLGNAVTVNVIQSIIEKLFKINV